MNYKSLQQLPYGSVIEYMGQRYYKCQGSSCDILMAEKQQGVWHYISGTSHHQGKNWKNFKVLFTP